MSRAETTAEIAALEHLWLQVCGKTFHRPGCGCCAAQPIILQAATLAEGIEFALRARCRREKDLCSLTLLDAIQLGHHEDFSAWVQRLASSPDVETVRRTLGSIQEMLTSIGQGPVNR